MEEEKSAKHSLLQSQKQQPMSLNQRHRMLIDFSATSHSKPFSKLGTGEESEENQGRARLCDAFSSVAENHDIPSFSGITDFDCPSPQEPGALAQNESKFADEETDAPNFCGIADFADEMDPPMKVESSKVSKEVNNISELIKPSFSVSTNSNPDPQGVQEEPVKVRIAGRRRLCKISKKAEMCDNEKNGKSRNVEKKISEISDFDSPPLGKNEAQVNYGGGQNEIRDILDDLTSKLDFLSIEKKRQPKKITSTQDSGHPVNDLHIEKTEIPEYGSAASSFSVSSSSLSSSEKESRIGGASVNELSKMYDSDNEPEGTSSLWEGKKSKDFGEGLKRNDSKKIVGKSDSTIQYSTSTILREMEEEEEDDFVLLSGNGMKGKVDKHEKFKLSNVSKKIVGNSDSTIQYSTSTILREMGEEEEDDCVLLNGNCMEEKVDKHGKFKLPNVPNVVDILEDHADDFVLENESVALNHPKSIFRLPGKIAKMLFPYQREGLNWLWSLHCKGKGGVLGDDMGLGKTMQICGFLAGLFHSNLIRRALVVAPKTLLPHWIKELSVVGLSEKTREYFGTNVNARQYELQYVLQDKGVLLTTYDIVRNNSKSLSGCYNYNDDGSEDEMTTWDYMILDEGHLIKNPTTQRAKSLLDIAAAHRIIISGTPLQNNLKELWALFNFCCPELLGDKKWFRDKFERLINRGNEKNASEREKRVGSAVAKDLRDTIQPYFLRRLKSEVFFGDNSGEANRLSKKNEIIVWLKLTSCQRQIYEAFLKSEIVLSAFDGSPLAALTILKKICDHPLLLTKRAAEDVLEGMDAVLNQQDHGVAEKLAMHIADVAEKFDIVEKHDISCKTSFILSLLDDLIPNGHHVLIFSQTRKMLNLIEDSLVSHGYEFMRIDGTTKACDRLKIVNDFQEGRGASIFLLTSQVGGLGLTLTRADRVIVVDPAWNPSTDNQSVDRAYRIGQKKDVIVYRLMTCSTVEEKIYRMQIFKGGLFRTATEQKEQIRYFSKQDLQELFSLPKQGFDISLTQQQLLEEHDRQYQMEEPLKVHIKFLESLGIAGVSQHSLLFSKTAPAPVAQEEDRLRVHSTFIINSSSHSPIERFDGAQYAFKPKDLKVQHKKFSPQASVPNEAEIRERINRLAQIVANKDTMSRLPDKGERIHKQIAELKVELESIQATKTTENKTIQLDDISGEFQRVLNMKM